ncbi:MAG: DUF4235 domain-containing protein [Candidatus Nanopelagicales bacterium]|nr:DUF4235 domain-containing protein [Candidatus Nanopelagicales bacterium]
MSINARTIAPFAAMGVTWAARKGMAAVYTSRTGHPPPTADDREVSITRVLVWAITTAMVSATITVVINRVAAEYADDDDAVTGSADAQLEQA